MHLTTDDILGSLSTIMASFTFKDVHAFRQMLQSTNAILSGSAALAIFEPKRFTPTDLDFYVHLSNMGSLMLFLSRHEYYVETTCDYSHLFANNNDNDVAMVLTLRNFSAEKNINIIVAMDGRRLLSIITHFDSTIAMNYVAWYGFVSMYSTWTSANQGLITNKRESERWIDMYRTRGFSLFNRATSLPAIEMGHICGQSYSCPKTQRYLFDRDTLFIPFSYDRPPFIFNYEEYFTWSLACRCDIQP